VSKTTTGVIGDRMKLQNSAAEFPFGTVLIQSTQPI